MALRPRQIVLIAAGLLFLILLLQNTHIVMLYVLFWKFGMSQIILILLMLALGFGVGFFLGKNYRDR